MTTTIGNQPAEGGQQGLVALAVQPTHAEARRRPDLTAKDGVNIFRLFLHQRLKDAASLCEELARDHYKGRGHGGTTVIERWQLRGAARFLQRWAEHFADGKHVDRFLQEKS